MSAFVIPTSPPAIPAGQATAEFIDANNYTGAVNFVQACYTSWRQLWFPSTGASPLDIFNYWGTAGFVGRVQAYQLAQSFVATLNLPADALSVSDPLRAYVSDGFVRLPGTPNDWSIDPATGVLSEAQA